MPSKPDPPFNNQERECLCIAILSFNEAPIIRQCLESAQFADQLLVIDSGSSDSTLEIARSYGAEVHIYDDWQGFGVQRNRALSLCHCKYIFFLDCDEVISVNLAQEIRAASQQGHISCGLIRWDDHVFGKRLRGIHQTKGISRLFKVDTLSGFDGVVHEGANFRGAPQTALFQARLTHYSRRSIYQSILKLAQYSQLGAIKLQSSNHRTGVVVGLVHALPRFMNLYIFKLSFLSGEEGFLYSLFVALEVFFKYCAARYDSAPLAGAPARR